MKKQLRFSFISSTVLLAVVTTCSASHGHHHKANYKGEAMAQTPCPTPLMIKDGFYLGAQLGYDSYRIRNSTYYSNTSSTLAFNANPALSAAGWVGGLFGGYGRYFNDLYYLAGELFVNTSGASTSWSTRSTLGTTPVKYNSEINVGTSWGISLLPGIKLNDASLLYIRLGYEQARIKTKEYLGTPPAPPITLAHITTSQNNWRSGFNYGLGIESTFYPNWSVRTEYNHTNYGSFTNPAIGTSFSSSDNQFMVGLNYHFA